MFGRKKKRGAKPAASKNTKPIPAKAKQVKKTKATPTENKRTKAVKSQNATSKSSAMQKTREHNGLFKFRRYKVIEGGASSKARHPKLIVSQEQKQVGFMGLTESKKRGHHKNIELDINPKKGDTRKAYLRKEIRYDDIEKFGDILNDYNLSESDKRKVIEYIKKLKKKK